MSQPNFCTPESRITMPPWATEYTTRAPTRDDGELLWRGGPPGDPHHPPEAYHRPALHRKHRQSTYLDETKPLFASDLVKSSRIDEYIIGRIPRKWGRGGRYKQRNQVEAALQVNEVHLTPTFQPSPPS